MSVTVVGAGLAGCEAAWQLALRGIHVRLIEMKPVKFSPAHQSADLAELVCSNSLRSSSLFSGPGLLKEELRLMNSLIMRAADSTSVPAGKALAVDRKSFSEYIGSEVMANPLIQVERFEVKNLASVENGLIIVATGPLTSDALADEIIKMLGADGLHFYDAIAPIVTDESLDASRLFRASRYGTDEGDYLNAAMDEELYKAFVKEVLEAEKVEPYPFENIPHFEGCLPIEELARRGIETLAFGPMKPVGLVDPATGKRPYAVVQLRTENKAGSLYNLVGFQTKMTYPEQQRVFRMIPGLDEAVFARLGSIHRNTYIDSPRLLDEFSRAKTRPDVFFAGQITGVEGYIESTASGLAVGVMAALIQNNIVPSVPNSTTAIGALLKHTRNKDTLGFVPMNINFGIIDPAPKSIAKNRRKEFVVERALKDAAQWKACVEGLFPCWSSNPKV
jgi:methylenetetrahydrofolate--tRNA-(uracil-5-)-methyltransferase